MSKWVYPYKVNGKKLRIYNMWVNMKQRCTNPSNPNYCNYGGRGIKVCVEWFSYDNFYEWVLSQGYDDSLDRKYQSIDRVNVDGDYEPSNCRLATMLTQQRNRRNNIKIGEKCLSQVVEECGKCAESVKTCIYSGKDISSIRDYEHIVIDGYTLREISDIYKVDYNLLRNRVRKGERKLEKLVDPENKGYHETILIEGKTLRDISESSGIPLRRIRGRYYQGKTTIEELTRK